MLSEEVELKLEDLLTNILLTLDIKKKEMPPHGLDIMLNHNSVLMEMLLMSKIHVNVMELFGLVEDKMRRVIELQLGINSECGHLLQKLKINILDATNILLEIQLVYKAI